MNLVGVKRLGMAGMVFSTCLSEKCDFVLFLAIWFVTELGSYLYVRLNVLSFVWRGREAEAVVFFGRCMYMG